jgi:hypothetical protein
MKAAAWASMMRRRLKLIFTSVVVACFAVLEAAHAVRPAAVAVFVPASELSRPNAALVRHVALEVASGADDFQSPTETGTALNESELVLAPTRARVREHIFLPLGSFWSGRILRRIASAEPDGH